MTWYAGTYSLDAEASNPWEAAWWPERLGEKNMSVVIL